MLLYLLCVVYSNLTGVDFHTDVTVFGIGVVCSMYSACCITAAIAAIFCKRALELVALLPKMTCIQWACGIYSACCIAAAIVS